MSGAMTLQDLRLRAIGLRALAARGNTDAARTLSLVEAKIKALAAVEEPLFGRTK